MRPNTPHLSRGLLPALAVFAGVAVGAVAIGGSATAGVPAAATTSTSSPTPTSTAAVDAAVSVPVGYVQIFDDTGFLTVVVPESWSDIEARPIAEADGTSRPTVAASPDIELLINSFDVPGVLFSAFRYQADPQALYERFRLRDACQDLVTEPYTDPVFTGIVEVGTGCGSTGAATWKMVVASPADASFTALVQVQTATAADDEALQIVLQSFNSTGVGQVSGTTSPVATAAPITIAPSTVPGVTVPAVTVPGVTVPAGLGPVDVARMFLDAFATGDGATACALMTAEEMTINFVENAETCAAELSLEVAGQGPFWASVQISGDETTSSPGQCGDEDPADESVSLELSGPTDVGCLSLSIENGEWRINDLSNSIWNQSGSI